MSVAEGAPAADAKAFFGHPRGLMTLFLTEMWERFSFYGMRALLALYLITPPDGVSPPGGGLGLDDGSATAIYGTYLSLVYVFPLMGGWIADRMWGARRTVLWGGIVITAGHFLMAVPIEALFWIGLLSVALGTGLLKPNVSALVGGLYVGSEEARRDSGFSIFYMGINLGALIAPIVCGTISEWVGWHVAFAAAGVGMMFGLIQYVRGGKYLGDVGTHVPNPAPPELRRKVGYSSLIGVAAFAAVVAVVSLLTGGFNIDRLVDILSIVILLLPIIYFRTIFTKRKLSDVERSRVKAFVFLFLVAAMFWLIFDQSGSTLNIFAEKHTDLSIGSFAMPASWLQSVEPAMVIIFAPVFATIWMKLADRAPSTPVKFALGLVGVGISYLVMVFPGLMADEGNLSSVWWLVSIYVIQSWAELLLSPTGLSATTRLAPTGMAGQMLALWFLAAAVGDTIGGQLANLLSGLGLASYFGLLGSVAVLLGLLMLLISPKVRGMMVGIK